MFSGLAALLQQMMRIILFITIFALLFGCSSGLNYRKLNHHLSSNNCKSAVEYMEQTEGDYGSNAKLLFLLDSAMVNMYCGNFEISQKSFHKAEDLADILWTKSVSKNIFSLVSNEYVLPYNGEDFERAMINLMSAIGYLQADQVDEALVEFRRLDALLTLYNSKYEKKNVYKEDAFARYLSGIVHETDKELDDAFIDYYKACQIYAEYKEAYGTHAPSSLEEDLLRVAEIVDRMDEAKSVVPDVEKRFWLKQQDAADLGKIVFIQFIGHSPLKTENIIFIPTHYGPVTLAFPKFSIDPPQCRNSLITLTSASNTTESKTVLVEDINQIAVKNLSDRKGRVVAKTIARAIAKQIAIKEISELNRDDWEQTIRVLLNLVNSAIERADTRSWRTLPGEIYLARVFVPAGHYQLSVSRCGVAKKRTEPVKINVGETRYILHDSRYSF